MWHHFGRILYDLTRLQQRGSAFMFDQTRLLEIQGSEFFAGGTCRNLWKVFTQGQPSLPATSMHRSAYGCTCKRRTTFTIAIIMRIIRHLAKVQLQPLRDSMHHRVHVTDSRVRD